MTEAARKENAWVGAYVHAFDGLEDRAAAKIAGIKVLDYLAAQAACDGFGRYLVTDEESDPLLVEGYGHTAECGTRYERLYVSLVSSGERFASERAFLGLHDSVFAGCERCGRYADAAGGIRRFDDEGFTYLYTAASPQDKPLELRRALAAYRSACTACPELSMAYLGLLSVHINHVHPFRDGNGRTIRILVASELARMGLQKAADIPLAVTGKRLVSATLLRYGGLYGLPDDALCADHPESIPDYESFSHLGEHGLMYLDMLLAAYRLLLTVSKRGEEPADESGSKDAPDCNWNAMLS